MTTTILLILAVSLDSVSFGLAQGFLKNKIKLSYALCMTLLSVILFATPLYLSSLVFKHLSKNTCYLINGIVLLLLGLYYLITSLLAKEQPNINKKTINLRFCIVNTFPISLDALFTAFFNGIFIKNKVFAILFFALVTFISLYIVNIITLQLSKKCKISLNWLSGLVFIILGILKILEI